MALKVCSLCNRKLSLNDFYYRKSGKYGRACWCKNCTSIRNRERNTPEVNRIKNQKAKSKLTPEKITRRNEKRRVATKRKRLFNPEALNDKSRVYYHAIQKCDPSFRIAHAWRARIWSALKENIKSDSSENLLGCSWDQFLGHLEINFSDGMCWDNYGQWHVDHIKPLARFDLSKPEEQRKAFHWSNHQPLWAIDNLRKGTKVNG